MDDRELYEHLVRIQEQNAVIIEQCERLLKAVKAPSVREEQKGEADEPRAKPTAKPKPVRE